MKCPGQERRYWIGEPTFEMPCPKCGTMVELFRDEGSGRCRNCGHRFPNPKAAFGCAKWCPQAKECVGLAPPKVVPDGTADRSLAARLIQAVEKELADDPPRLAHALLVFQHAKQLLEREGGDPRSRSRGRTAASVDTGRSHKLGFNWGFAHLSVGRLTQRQADSPGRRLPGRYGPRRLPGDLGLSDGRGAQHPRSEDCQ